MKGINSKGSVRSFSDKEISKERLHEVAKVSTVEGETIHNMPFNVTADKLGSL